MSPPPPTKITHTKKKSAPPTKITHTKKKANHTHTHPNHPNHHHLSELNYIKFRFFTPLPHIQIMYKDSDPLQSTIKTKINIYLCDRFNEISSSSSSSSSSRHKKWALVLDSKTTRTSNQVRFYAFSFERPLPELNHPS